MVDYLPPENHAVSSLLAVIADPKASQKRLDQLNKAQADYAAQVAAVNEKTAALAALSEEHKKELDLISKNRDDLAYQRRDTELQNEGVMRRSGDVIAREVAVAQRERELEAREKDEVNKRVDLAKRQSDLAAAMLDHEHRVADLNKQQTAFQARLDKYKSI